MGAVGLPTQPQNGNPCPETRHMTYISLKSIHVCGLEKQKQQFNWMDSNPQNCPSSWRIFTPAIRLNPTNVISYAADVDRFSSFRRAQESDHQRQTDRQTDRPTTLLRECVCIAIAAMRPINNKWSKNFDDRPHRMR